MVRNQTHRKQKRRGGAAAWENFYGWAFIGIALLLICAFIVYPVISSFLMSFKTGRGTVYTFSGLDNLRRLVNDKVFFLALKNTITYFIFQVPVMIFLALTIATILNDPKFKFKGFFRTAIFLPCVTSLVVYSVLFRSMFATEGLVNTVLVNLQIVEEGIPWLSDPFWGKILIITAVTWRWTGFNMMFYLAALRNIDPQIYEAAMIDGAGKVRQFFGISLPLLKPIILFTSIMSTIGSLQLFDETYNITRGGPGNGTISIAHYVYDIMFKYTPNFGYAATISYVVVIFVAILSFIQFKAAGDRNE